MDSRITHQHIANEAHRVWQITSREDQDANWQEAIENLEIFPKTVYDSSKLFFDDSDDSHLGIALDLPGIPCGAAGCRKQVFWYKCREVFERDLFLHGAKHGNYRYGFFYAPTLSLQETHIAKFIRDVELDRLHLSELTTFFRVTNRHYIYIRPSSFWTECEMRFSLFTVLLRAGRYYVKESIDDALTIFPYSRSTLPAIKLFFQGRRHYTGKIPNWQCKWVSQYKDKTEDQILTLA